MSGRSSALDTFGKRALVCFLLGSCSLIQAKAAVFHESRNLQDSDYFDECFDEMMAADSDGDMGLSSDEYVEFIVARSGGNIDAATYQELPLSLISNYVFTACQCSFLTGEIGCCVGDNARVGLDPSSPEAATSLLNFCRYVDTAIEDEVGVLPTPPPTFPPTDQPTTPAPTGVPTPAPTPPPILNPTLSPTPSPSASPSVSPSLVFSSTPTMSPTASPTASPTNLASAAPSPAPSAATPMPTLEALSCIQFQYGIVNSVGVTADEIFNEVNNTLKTGLLIATRNITIEILNSTFPRQVRHLRQGQQPYSLAHERPRRQLAESATVYRLSKLPFSNLMLQDRRDGLNHGEDDSQRRLAYLKWNENSANMLDAQRRLVFYTDDFSPAISAIFNNPFCDMPTDLTECAIVASSVCVVLEEGDDEAEVQSTLLEGMEEAILNGEFEAAIPPEHRLPEIGPFRT